MRLRFHLAVNVGVHFLAMHAQLRRCVDADANLIAIDGEDNDTDIVGDDDRLIWLTG